jgi:hypothetical protein
MKREGVLWVRRHLRRPFSPTCTRTFVHCCHHRAGTTWLQGVLFQLASEFGLRVSLESGNSPCRWAHLLFYEHARDFSPTDFAGRQFRGSHMIRDPRDLIVSSYFYHLWTAESWAHEPRPDLGGKTYQEHLRSIPQHAGLMMELERTAQWQIRDMLAWNYHQPMFLEMRYEDLLADQAAGFEQLFRFYGLSDRAIARGVEIASEHSFHAKTGRRIGQTSEHAHLRSGRPGEWRDVLDGEHLFRLAALVGDAAGALGYERA